MTTYIVTTATGVYERINGANGQTRAGVGDTVVINSGIYGLTAGKLTPNYGVSIIGMPGSVLVPSGSKTPISVEGLGTDVWYSTPIVLSGITLDCSQGSDTSTYGGIYVYGCSINLYKCIISGKTANNNNGFTANALSTNGVYANLYNCQIYNVSGDCVSGRGGGLWLAESQNSYVKLYNCLVHSCGQKTNGGTQGAADQLFTSHDGVPVYAYGCTFYNGTHYSGPAPGYIYFSDIDVYRRPTTASGINSSASAVGHHVLYGNISRSTFQFSFTTKGSGTNPGNPGDRVWIPPQVQLRQYGLCKNNYIKWDPVTANGNLLFTPSNGNLIIDGNKFLSTGVVTNKCILRMFTQQEDTRSTGVHIIFKNNYFDCSPDTDLVRSSQAIPVGTGLNLEIVNNTFSRFRSIITGGSSADLAVAAASNTVFTKLVNNFIASGNITRGNTAESDVWGIIWMSGNVMRGSQPTSFPGTKHYSAGNTFLANITTSGSGALYYPVEGSAIDYDTGVDYSIQPTQDAWGPSEGSRWIGSAARPRYDQTEFPTSVVTY